MLNIQHCNFFYFLKLWYQLTFVCMSIIHCQHIYFRKISLQTQVILTFGVIYRVVQKMSHSVLKLKSVLEVRFYFQKFQNFAEISEFLLFYQCMFQLFELVYLIPCLTHSAIVLGQQCRKTQMVWVTGPAGYPLSMCKDDKVLT